MTFLHLPLLDLIVVQRVSRDWKAAINASCQIRRALFLESSTTLIVEPRYVPDYSDRADSLPAYEWTLEDGIKPSHRPLLNPFLNHFVARDEDAFDVYGDPGCLYGPTAALLNFCLIEPSNNGLRDEWADRVVGSVDKNTFQVSLHRMLPMQPRIRQRVFSCPYRCLSENLDPRRLHEFYEAWQMPMPEWQWEEREARWYSADTSDDFDKHNLPQPDFQIELRPYSKGLIRIGDIVSGCWDHFQDCEANCRLIEEIEAWRWQGDTDLDILDGNVGEITGYEMLAELKKRFG